MPDTLLAFDFGAKRTGVAVGNTLTKTATALQTIREEASQARLSKVALLIKEWQPNTLIVGRPLHPDGTPHAMTARAEKFARALQAQFRLPLKLVDERYSSAVVADQNNVSTDVDAQAAQNILQQYFDEREHFPGA